MDGKRIYKKVIKKKKKEKLSKRYKIQLTENGRFVLKFKKSIRKIKIKGGKTKTHSKWIIKKKGKYRLKDNLI